MSEAPQIAIARHGKEQEASRPLVRAALFAGLIGLGLIWGVGFAGPDALHAAAHDARHSLTFPCH